MKRLFVIFLFALSLWGAPYTIGQNVAALNLQDQFGKSYVLKTMPKTVVMAFEKNTAATVNEYLATREKGYLKKYDAAFIADISGMPNFIAESFALPKMRQYSHTILLIRDEEQGLKFPGTGDKLTVMRFEGNILSDIYFISTEAELKEAIEHTGSAGGQKQ